jgi:hypothetical protein
MPSRRAPRHARRVLATVLIDLVADVADTAAPQEAAA